MNPLDRIRVYGRVVFRQLLRNRRRTALTFLGLVVSFFLYTSLQSLLRTLAEFLDQSGSETMLVLRPRTEFGLIRPELPRHYAARLLEMPGVAAASAIRLHVGQGRQDGVPAVALGVDVQSFYDTHRPLEIRYEDLELLENERGGALAGRALLEQNGWAVGSRVTVRGFGQQTALPVRVVGAIDDDDRLASLMLVSIDYMEEVLGDAGRASFIEARVERPAYALRLTRAIDAQFANFSVPTETTTQRTELSTALSNLSDAFLALKAVGYLTLGITILVVGNSISMSIRERTVEIGTLRALGFGRLWVAQMVIGESVLVSIAGGLVGALAVFALYNSGTVRPFGETSLQVVVPTSVFAEVFLLAIPIGTFAALPTLWSALRMPIAKAVRAAA